MIYKEERKDLFTVEEDYYLAHCISADFGMGRGIVVEFNRRFNMKNRLMAKYPNYETYHRNIENYADRADCILEDKVFNLITKSRYWGKPTYNSLTSSLIKMREIMIANKITKVAMPVIGCGLDRLNWDRVSEIIKEVFNGTDFEILVCKQ